MSIGSRTHEEFMEEARAFHGYPAPGLIIGGYMVELAKRHMPEGVLYDAVSETAHCLPDAVQLLTPCTFGNGWLRVLPFGIYAVTLIRQSYRRRRPRRARQRQAGALRRHPQLVPQGAPQEGAGYRTAAGPDQGSGRVDPLVPQGPHPSGHARAPFVRGDHPLPALRLPLPRLLRRGSAAPARDSPRMRTARLRPVAAAPYARSRPDPGRGGGRQARPARHDADHPGQGKGCRVRRRAGAFRRRHLPPPANGQKPRLRSGKHAASRGLGA